MELHLHPLYYVHRKKNLFQFNDVFTIDVYKTGINVNNIFILTYYITENIPSSLEMNY